MLKESLLLIAIGCVANSAQATPVPQPYGAVPTPAQLAWADMEVYAFVHFTINTFTGREWGLGNEDPALFNPTAFSADQIVGTLAETGFKGVIFTAKHHDGFCLWPTKTTEHNITKSPWENGKGDMVKEFANAAARYKIKFGVYLSPWDRNAASYGTPAYVDLYRAQLRELLTSYGPLFEIWHDGANGGDGYYGGDVLEKRKIDAATYYDWPTTRKMIRELQPNAAIWAEPCDARWVGNEKGIADYPCWATVTPNPPKGPTGHEMLNAKLAGTGMPDGTRWSPAEADVSIRPGWFYHAAEDKKVRSPANLLDLYFKSVGRGASLLLNVPPDQRGRIHENDVASLKGFKQALDQLYAVNFAAGAKVTADAVRGAEFSPDNVLKKGRETYWSTPDGKTSATLTLDLPEKRTFDAIRLAEAIQLGQRVRKFAVDVRENDAWREWIADGSSIGMHTILRGPLVMADGVRVRILESAASPCLSELSLLRVPEMPAP